MADTIFAKIIAGDVPADKVWDDERCIAIRDINPRAPVHVLVIPREPVASINDVNLATKDLLGHLTWVAMRIARTEGLADSGYRLVWNTGKDGGQSVDHIHLHLLGGRQMDWPPG